MYGMVFEHHVDTLEVIKNKLQAMMLTLPSVVVQH